MSFGTHELASLFQASSLTYLYSLESVTDSAHNHSIKHRFLYGFLSVILNSITIE
jgi:hypothetical protein